MFISISQKFVVPFVLLLALSVSSALQVRAGDEKKAPGLEGFKIIKVAPGLSVSDRVINLFLPYIGNHPESLEGRPTLDLSMRHHDEMLVVDLTLKGYLDDSVAGEQYRGFVVRSSKGWELIDLGVKPLCYRGLGKSGNCQ